ncbi:MAG TPA: hypothetical protein VF529_20925 [Solirubrobacteraceae bacterium]|jgi:ElaB/YqjD/DUF883 family membrane-anchored ribosome-binding protein
MASIPTQGHGPGGTTSAPSEDSSATEQAREKAGEVAGQAQEKAQELAGQASEQAKQAAGQAKDRVREQLDQRSTQAGEQVAGQAGDIRSVAEQLREQGKDKPAELAEQAADRVERVGSYLRDNDADRILGDVEDFARQKPWLVIAGGIALGFAASRFVKASSQDRYYSRTPDQLPNTATRPAHTTQPPAGPRTGAPLRPTGNGGPAETTDGPPTSTGAL